MLNTLGHTLVTLPAVIGFFIYIISIDEIRSDATRDFSQKAFERGIMVECEGYEGYFWECQTTQ
jgi:hypothetical protein